MVTTGKGQMPFFKMKEFASSIQAKYRQHEWYLRYDLVNDWMLSVIHAKEEKKIFPGYLWRVFRAMDFSLQKITVQE